jgi:hypothetical protein
MCRSYSLQVFVGVLATGLLLRYLEIPSRLHALWIGGAVLAAIYAHYVPGLALLAVANLALALRREWRHALWMDALVSAGILPWAVMLAHSLNAWGGYSATYAAVGGPAEIALKVGYWAMSFSIGETVPDPLLIAALILVPVAVLARILWPVREVKFVRTLTLIVLALAAIGFPAVARWVSYPFIPARLLFLLPLVLVLFAARANTASAAALLALALAGDWCYFHRIGFRNKQYPMPIREIAQLAAAPSLVLVDSTNSDPVAMRYALGPEGEVFETASPRAFEQLDAPGTHTVWFLRNTHDVSADGLNARFEQHLRGRLRLASVRQYEPFTPLELRMMQAIGMRDPPRYFSELLEFRAP